MYFDPEVCEFTAYTLGLHILLLVSLLLVKFYRIVPIVELKSVGLIPTVSFMGVFPGWGWGVFEPKYSEVTITGLDTWSHTPIDNNSVRNSR